MTSDLPAAKAAATAEYARTGVPHSVIDINRDGSSYVIYEGRPEDFPRVDRERIIFTAMPAPNTVYVAVYEHRYGTDIRVFRDEADAWSWKRTIALDWYDREIQGTDKPDTDEGVEAEYWDMINDEFFTVESCRIEG